MTADLVLVETRGAVAPLTLNRPDKLNALDCPLIDRLMAVLDRGGRRHPRGRPHRRGRARRLGRRRHRRHFGFAAPFGLASRISTAPDARPAHCTGGRMRLVVNPPDRHTAAPVDARAG
jgi:hypothetical protein